MTKDEDELYNEKEPLYISEDTKNDEEIENQEDTEKEKKTWWNKNKKPIIILISIIVGFLGIIAGSG